MKEIAILMAAGLGSRMRPLTEKTPKPLLLAQGKPMIETVIEGLLTRPVDEIYVVTGYLGEQFRYLTEKYRQVRLIANPDYLEKNNISSIFAARELLGEGNCFICESDLLVRDVGIFQKQLAASCYYGRMQPGHTDDWAFRLQGNRISWIGKGGESLYNMVGIAYFQQTDAKILREIIEEVCRYEENGQLFWDEAVNANLDRLYLQIEPVMEGQITEIDTVEELSKINESISFVN